MKKIKSIHFSYLRNDGHAEFMLTYQSLLSVNPGVFAVVENFYPDFGDLLSLEAQLINTMRKSDYTEPIAEADQRIDRTITGMNELISASLRHFNPEVVAAAKSLKNRFDAFGDITRKTYEEETMAVTMLLIDLASEEYVDKVTLIGMTDWVTELTAAEDAFTELLALRNSQTAQKPEGRLTIVRKEIEAVYRKMCDVITAAAIMNTSEEVDFDTFIAELNAKIDYFNEHNHQHAKKDLSAGDSCVIEPIPTQEYTEKAVTPIPKVHYRQSGKATVELAFAKDFDVSYKNNVNVGTANLIVRGKGAYKGQKITAFNIAR